MLPTLLATTTQQVRVEEERCPDRGHWAMSLSKARRTIGQQLVYSHRMLTIASQIDAMNRIGRAMADSTRSRILLSLLQEPGYPAQLARDLSLTRTNVSNHLACLRGCGIIVATPEGRQTRYEIADPHLTSALKALVDVVLAVDDGLPCIDKNCNVPLCCTTADPDTTATLSD